MTAIAPPKTELRDIREWARKGGEIVGDSFDETGIREGISEAGRIGIFEALITGNPELRLKLSLALPELALGCGKPGQLLSIGAHGFAVANTIAKFGSEYQKSEILPDLLRGTTVGAFAATEANSGSDVMALATRYRSFEGGYKLKGEKSYITNAPIADWLLCFATSDPSLNFRGLSAFLVPTENDSVQITEDRTVFGSKELSIGTVTFADTLIPKHAILGHRNQGHQIFNFAIQIERVLMSGFFVGLISASLENSILSLSRKQRFGTPVLENPVVAARLADMKLCERASRLVYENACEKLHLDQLTPLDAALTKLCASENLNRACSDHVRNCGGEALLAPNPAAALLLHSASSLIYSGTSDVQRIIAADSLLSDIR